MYIFFYFLNSHAFEEFFSSVTDPKFWGCFGKKREIFRNFFLEKSLNWFFPWYLRLYSAGIIPLNHLSVDSPGYAWYFPKIYVLSFKSTRNNQIHEKQSNPREFSSFSIILVAGNVENLYWYKVLHHRNSENHFLASVNLKTKKISRLKS